MNYFEMTEIFRPFPFSVLSSEYVRPIEETDWNKDSMVVRNARDILREMCQIYKDIVTTVKVFDLQSIQPSRKRKRGDEDSE